MSTEITEINEIKQKAEELNVLLINLHRAYQHNTHFPTTVAQPLLEALDLLSGNMGFITNMAKQSVITNATAVLARYGFTVTDKEGKSY